MRHLSRLALLLAAVVAANITPARSAVLETTFDLPVTVKDARGATVRQPIKVTLYRDDGRAKSPFLLLNHGRSSEVVKRRAVAITSFAPIARYLVGQGFAVLVPVRIGYGATGGPDIENSGACEHKVYAPGYVASTDQSLAVIAHARSLPFIDAERGLVMGLSYGGTTAIALAARRAPGVLAAINFAGGGGGRPDTHPDDPCRPDLMRQLFASYGETARMPTLWLYSENDRYWGRTLPRQWLQAFVGRGGRGEFVELPAFKDDGHGIFARNPAAWKPAFEAFRARCCGGLLADR